MTSTLDNVNTGTDCPPHPSVHSSVRPTRFFSVPADFRRSTIDQYAELNRQYEFSRVRDTYGQITIDNRFGSGRYAKQLPAVGFAELAEYVQYSASKGIGFNYTLNASHMANRDLTPEGISELRDFLRKLYETGIRSLTIAMPTVIEIAQSLNLQFEIRLSTVAQVLNANQALAYKNAGLDYLVVSEQINRDFATLSRIRKSFGEKVEVIVNSICHIDCTNRRFHYDQNSMALTLCVPAASSFFERRCVARRFAPLANHIRLSWIRPEDLRYYEDVGIRYFKLQGRQAVLVGNPAQAVEAYFANSFDGNLLELLELFVPATQAPVRIYLDNKRLNDFLLPFVRKTNFCRNDCEACRYCDSVARKAIDIARSNPAIQFWSMLKSDDRDPYKMALK